MRHSGIAWSPADRRRATCGCARGRTSRPLLDGPADELPEAATAWPPRTTVEILNLRPTMSYRLPPARTERNEADMDVATARLARDRDATATCAARVRSTVPTPAAGS